MINSYTNIIKKESQSALLLWSILSIIILLSSGDVSFTSRDSLPSFSMVAVVVTTVISSTTAIPFCCGFAGDLPAGLAFPPLRRVNVSGFFAVDFTAVTVVFVIVRDAVACRNFQGKLILKWRKRRKNLH